MKLNKIQFKKILKECIRELIVEGAFDNVVTENLAAQYTAPSPRRHAADDFVSTVATPSYQPEPIEGRGRANARLDELSRVAAEQCSHGDPQQAAMMESIFVDTAKTTLQKRLAFEGGGGAYVGEPMSAQEEALEMAELDQLAGGQGAGHWAALAFGKYEKE